MVHIFQLIYFIFFSVIIRSFRILVLIESLLFCCPITKYSLYTNIYVSKVSINPQFAFKHTERERQACTHIHTKYPNWIQLNNRTYTYYIIFRFHVTNVDRTSEIRAWKIRFSLFLSSSFFQSNFVDNPLHHIVFSFFFFFGWHFYQNILDNLKYVRTFQMTTQFQTTLAQNTLSFFFLSLSVIHFNIVGNANAFITY